LTSFIKALKYTGYFDKSENVISLEVKPIKGEDPDLVIAGSKRVLIRAIENL